MTARQATHSLSCEYEEEAQAFLERVTGSTRYALDGTSRSKDRKILTLQEEIVWIEGTLSVAF